MSVKKFFEQQNLDPDFKKSSLSPIAGGVWCVEVKRTPTNVLVRDSKDPDGTVLDFTSDEWGAFIGGVKQGEFDV